MINPLIHSQGSAYTRINRVEFLRIHMHFSNRFIVTAPSPKGEGF
jgi:hypothetical protein